MSPDNTLGFRFIERTLRSGFQAETIVVDHDNPSFDIRSEQSYPYRGNIVHKVGAGSGWTYGDVVDTCQDINAVSEPVIFYCQDIAAGEADDGDSGAPVFLRSGENGAVLIGLHWGYNYNAERRAFSAMWNIQFELGDLITY